MMSQIQATLVMMIYHFKGEEAMKDAMKSGFITLLRCLMYPGAVVVAVLLLAADLVHRPIGAIRDWFEDENIDINYG